MLDLKTVKEIRIAEGLVKKITDSSGVVLWQKVVAPSVSLDVDLNNQWVESTKTLDGYKVYMSNSNHNVDSSYASMKFKFKGQPDFKIWINSYAESNYDYTVAWDMDKDYPTSHPAYNSTGVKAHTRGNQKDPTNITAFTEVDYTNDGGEHFVVVTYRKDSSVNNNDDRGYVAVKLTLLSTTWVVSSTEFVKKDNKYYQRLNEVGTYEGGFTANTGNYKVGNELPVTYKQGSADDYMIVGNSMYYKNYAYVTPKDQEINTGDYVQGDYIGEATPAMKVTYADNTEKTFYNLTSIEENTDSNKGIAKNVIIYDGVTSIGDWAFSRCESITSITIPDSVISIGKNAFNGCTSLTAITIPSGVTGIGWNVFEGCSSLASIIIPANVTYISSYAFQNCSSLSSVTIQNSTSKLPYGYNAFANIDSTAKLYVPSNLLSDYQADSSWKNAFKGGIYAIGTIPTPAMKVTYADNTEKEFYNLTSIQSDTVSNKTNVKNVIIYDGVTSIGQSAFEDCSNLKNITLPSSITTIGNFAFYGSSLTSVTIPSNATDIGQKAFKLCESLVTVTIQNSTSKLAYNTDAFANIPSTAKLYVPSNLLSAYQADSNWTGAFKGGIFEILIPAMKVTYVDGTEKTFNNLTTIGENTDSNKKNAKSVEIYDSVTEIGNNAFNGCSSLTGITLPNSLTIIGDDAFYNCTYLTNIAIPNSVTNIGNYAFFFCVRVTSITLSDSLTTIGEGAFKMCANLTSITIPANVTTIGNNVFDRCEKLATITVEATTPPSIGDNFLSTNSLGQIKTNTIYVPAASLDAYKSATNWSAFASKIKAIGS